MAKQYSSHTQGDFATTTNPAEDANLWNDAPRAVPGAMSTQATLGKALYRQNILERHRHN